MVSKSKPGNCITQNYKPSADQNGAKVKCLSAEEYIVRKQPPAGLRLRYERCPVADNGMIMAVFNFRSCEDE